MSEPLQPDQPKERKDAIPAPDSLEQKGGGEVVETAREAATSAIRLNLTDQQINAPRKPIREGDLRALRESLAKRKEVQELSALEGTMLSTGGHLDEAVSKFIECTKKVSMVFLQDAETECVAADIDLAKVRVLIQLGSRYALALADSKHKNPDAFNALKEWQTRVAAEHPGAVMQLIESYKHTIAAELAEKIPDPVSVRGWVNTCARFAPELATDLEEKFHEALSRYCEYYLSRAEEEFAKDTPNMTVIGQNIPLPVYCNRLPPGSPVLARVKVVQEKFDALKKK